jgi:hypothetical protein
MNDDDRTLFRARNSVRYSEFRTMPSKARTNRWWPRKAGPLVVLIRSQLGIVPGSNYSDFRNDNRRSDGLIALLCH